jgi:hypothetical protein
MVQVDIAWAYGVGASFAVVGQRYLRERSLARWRDGFLTAPYLHVLFFGLLILGPLTAQLLWSFPDWQLMYAFDLPPSGWLVAGILVVMQLAASAGYAVSWTLLRAQRLYLAYLNFIAGYFLLFFGIVYGWDGTGYQRLLSANRASLEGWTWADAQDWLQSDIVATYNIQMLILVPYLLFIASRWIARDSVPRRNQLLIVGQLIVLVFVATLGSALLASVVLIQFAPAVSLPMIAAGAVVAFHPDLGMFARLHRWTFAALTAQRR